MTLPPTPESGWGGDAFPDSTPLGAGASGARVCPYTISGYTIVFVSCLVMFMLVQSAFNVVDVRVEFYIVLYRIKKQHRHYVDDLHVPR